MKNIRTRKENEAAKEQKITWENQLAPRASTEILNWFSLYFPFFGCAQFNVEEENDEEKQKTTAQKIPCLCLVNFVL